MTHELVILSYNALAALAVAVETAKATFTGKIVVVDNASSDATRAWLKYQKGITVVLNAENQKFTRGFDEYLKTSQADLVTLMNCDCLCEHGWQAAVEARLQDTPDAGLVCPLLLDPSGQTVVHAGGQPDLLGHVWGPASVPWTSRRIQWGTFAFVTLRMAAYREVGGMDRAFEHYCSDSDLCHRMWVAGWSVWLEATARVRHVHMVSTKALAQVDPKAHQACWDDQPRFNQKWATHGLTIGGSGLFAPEPALCSGAKDPLLAAA